MQPKMDGGTGGTLPPSTAAAFEKLQVNGYQTADATSEGRHRADENTPTTRLPITMTSEHSVEFRSLSLTGTLKPAGTDRGADVSRSSPDPLATTRTVILSQSRQRPASTTMGVNSLAVRQRSNAG